MDRQLVKLISLSGDLRKLIEESLSDYHCLTKSHNKISYIVDLCKIFIDQIF